MDDTPPAACPPAAAELEPPGSAPRKYGERPSPDEFEEEELAVAQPWASRQEAPRRTPLVESEWGTRFATTTRRY